MTLDINTDEYNSSKTQGISMCANDKRVIYFDSFGVEHISEEVKRFIGDKTILTKIFRIQQASDSIMRGAFPLDLLSLCSAIKS